jgi:hypothetical protein
LVHGFGDSENNLMTSPEENRQVFIVRIWREVREIEGKLPEWRGLIESVQSGERRYFKDLEEISTFIAPYLEGLSAKSKLFHHLWQRFKR